MTGLNNPARRRGLVGMTGATILALQALLVAPAMAQPSAAEYAVKFVCGHLRDGTSHAYGSYFTAVNVHNPGPDSAFSYKVAVALVGTPGPVTGFDNISLSNDQAVELDCRSIRNQLRNNGMAVAGFFTGFLVIRPRQGELDVVAVYTAAATEGGPPVSIHTERVPLRRTR